MTEDVNQSILRQYDERVGLYRDLASTVERLVKRMLGELKIPVHSVTSRVKDRESLMKKIARPGKNYAALTDITDIAGIRIVTYFEDDVDKVADRLKAEFSIDWANTTDKRAALDPDRFGYLTMQHIAEFGADRIEHFEYAAFRGLRFEIQTRSILQHAWAEMEHDLGYKSPASVPKEARRRFSRLAGLLEIADDEFRRLRDDLEKYRRDVPNRIREDPEEVEIDRDSLLAFIAESPIVVELDEAIARIDGSESPEPRSEHIEPAFIEMQVASLKMFGILTIEDLGTELRRHRSQIEAFVAEWLAGDGSLGPFEPGISLFYLAYVLAGESRDLTTIKRYIASSTILESNEEELAQRVLRVYESTYDHHS